tara:strand:+ start:13174 stop:13848 length:675 start_codon:yes stop_codon:yes gene_type:complete
MDRLWIGLALVGVLATGIIQIYFELKRARESHNLLIKFKEKYSRLIKNLNPSYIGILRSVDRLDREHYEWLTSNVDKVQQSLGVYGQLETYQPPYQQVMFKNYQLVISTLPKFRDGTVHTDEVNAVDNALIRGISMYDRHCERTKKELKNPFKWFREGVKFYLSSPILILNWFGIISLTTFHSLTSNFLFKVISKVAMLIGFFSSIVSLIIGWEQFSKILLDLF